MEDSPIVFKEWGPEECVRLLKLYKKCPALWNPQHVNFFKLDKKKQAWNAIAEEFEVPARAIKKKMNSLLASYRRERMKVRNSLSAKNGSREKYVPRWYAYEILSSFLDNNRFQRDPDKALIGEDGDSVPQDGEEQTTGGSGQEDSSSSSKLSVGQLANVLDTTADIVRGGGRVDECSNFGRHVANKMKGYDKYTRSLAEYLINTILYKADMGDFENTTGLSVASTSTAGPTSNPPRVSPYCTSNNLSELSYFVNGLS